MAMKGYKPTSPGRRFAATPVFDEITKAKPEKALTRPVKRKGGRNNNGRITTRHQGGGHKRRYRVIDFKRNKDGVPGKVTAIEYDPNRNRRIALVVYADGDKRYILAPNKVGVGSLIEAGAAPISVPGARFHCGIFRLVPWCTTSSCTRAAVDRLPARLVLLPRSWPRRATMPFSACPRARCG